MLSKPPIAATAIRAHACSLADRRGLREPPLARRERALGEARAERVGAHAEQPRRGRERPRGARRERGRGRAVARVGARRVRGVLEVVAESTGLSAMLAAAAEAAAAAAAKKDLLRCKNYGCGQSYKEGENHADVCVHHKSPPFFHDLKKGWSCCPGKVAYDWEEFQAIPGCVRSRHSTETPGAALGQSAEQEAKASFGGGGGDDVCPAVPAAPQPVLKKISDYNDANPDAASAAKVRERRFAPHVARDTRERRR